MLPDIPLAPAPHPHRTCCERGCGVRVTHYRWSPFFCPACDTARMERIDRQMAALGRLFGTPES
jgi:hypothetical protein